MELSLILLKQLVIMFLFIGVGLVMARKKMISEEGSRALSNLLLYGILPAAIMNSYWVERTPERQQGFWHSFFLSLAALLLSMAVSAICFRKKRIEHFGVAFSNAGFMGIPIVTAVLGTEAVFYISSFVALLNIFQWTYGVVVMTGSRECIQMKKLMRNPILISMAAGLFFFLTQIPIPQVLRQAVSSFAALNAPIAMIILGVFLAGEDLKRLFVGRDLYAGALARLVLIPFCTLVLWRLFPVDHTIRLSTLIAASAPVGSNVAVFAQMNHLDYAHASKVVCLSTVLSVISMPVIVGLTGILW